MYMLCSHSIKLICKTILDIKQIFDGKLGETKSLDHGLIRVGSEIFLCQACKGQIFHVPLQGIDVHARCDVVNVKTI